MQTLSLTKRPSKIGSSINTRTERHGDDEKPGVDIPLAGILLTEEELNAVLQDDGAHAGLFTNTRSTHAEPRFMGIDPLKLSDKFKGAKVTISAGGRKYVFKPATVQKIRLVPQVGGLTAMNCTVSCAPDDGVDVLDLLNRQCDVSILGGQLADRNEDQQELELGEAGPVDHVNGEGPGEEEEEETPESSIGRQIRRAKPKKKRAAASAPA